MKKTFSILIALMLCFAMVFSFAGCTTTTGEEEESDAFVAATIDTPDGLPTSTTEIIDFYNNIISSVQDNANFTAANRPGVKTNESIGAGNIEFVNVQDNENDTYSTDGLNASANAIKDRILGKIDTSVPVIAFGDMNTSVSSVIYPYDSAESLLQAEDVISAECNANGNNVNISIILAGGVDTINNVFGTRDKAAVLADVNENCKGYLTVADYTVDYPCINTEEEKTYSTINLSVELEKQDDGTYECTGRITNFNIKVIADVKATAKCEGSFADLENIEISFRLTDEKSYEFDWLGTAAWEPVEAVTE